MKTSIHTERQNELNEAKTNTYDVAIIGGGINGCAIARELALRGLNVILVEKKDIASGTSSASSKLAHGGIRYLEQGHFSLVRESCIERKRLVENAPHLVKPLPFILPVYKSSPFSLFKIRIGLWLYDKISFSSQLIPHKILNKAETINIAPHLNQKELIGSGLYYDAQLLDARLCIETAIQAKSFGATILNYVEATAFQTQSNTIQSITVNDHILNQTINIKAKLFINTTGPWTDILLKKLSNQNRPILRPSSGIHIVTKSLHSSHAFVLKAKSDNRVFFVMPWKGLSLIGTTDKEFKENPDNARVNESDIEYLIKETNQLFPNQKIKRADVISSFIGIRPLLNQEKGSVGSVSREEKIIKDHNLLSLVGGKYTTFRHIAEKVAKTVHNELNLPGKFQSKTENLSFWGGKIKNINQFIASNYQKEKNKFQINETIYKNIIQRYGVAYQTVLNILSEKTEYCETIENSNNYWGEIIYTIRFEMAKKVDDFTRRRTTLQLEYNLSQETLQKIENLFNQELS